MTQKFMGKKIKYLQVKEGTYTQLFGMAKISIQVDLDLHAKYHVLSEISFRWSMISAPPPHPHLLLCYLILRQKLKPHSPLMITKHLALVALYAECKF